LEEQKLVLQEEQQISLEMPLHFSQSMGCYQAGRREGWTGWDHQTFPPVCNSSSCAGFPEIQLAQHGTEGHSWNEPAWDWLELVTQAEQRWWRQEGSSMRGKLEGWDVKIVEHLGQRGVIIKETSIKISENMKYVMGSV
jgi:hypothetical protein